MKSVAVSVARPVRIVQNSAKAGNQWGRIKCADTGETLHVGQLKYIKRIAKARYNAAVSFASS